MGKRNTYSPEYKSKIVIEILEGEKTISEIAAREELNENMLKNWKKEFIENASRAFSTAKDEKEARKARGGISENYRSAHCSGELVEKKI